MTGLGHGNPQTAGIILVKFLGFCVASFSQGWGSRRTSFYRVGESLGEHNVYFKQVQMNALLIYHFIAKITHPTSIDFYIFSKYYDCRYHSLHRK